MSCNPDSCASCRRCESCGGCSGTRKRPMSPLEAALLESFRALPFQPVCRLTADELVIAPLFLRSPQDDGECVDAHGRALGSLAARGLISIDYEESLKGCDYAEYHSAQLLLPIQESASRFLLETGSMALTGKGQAVLGYWEE